MLHYFYRKRIDAALFNSVVWRRFVVRLSAIPPLSPPSSPLSKMRSPAVLHTNSNTHVSLPLTVHANHILILSIVHFISYFICNFIIQSIMKMNFLSETSSLEGEQNCADLWPSFREVTVETKFTGNEAVVVCNFLKNGRFEAWKLREKQVYVLISKANSGLKKHTKSRDDVWMRSLLFVLNRSNKVQFFASNLLFTLYLIF